LKDNSEFFGHYGFTVPENIINLKYKFYYKEKEVTLSYPVEIFDFIDVFRKDSNKSIVSFKDELEAIERLKTELLKIISNYSTTLENDKQEIKKAKVNKNFNLINIYSVLIEEKELLTNHIKVLDIIKLCFIFEEGFWTKVSINKVLETGLSPKYTNSLLLYFENLKK
jgi:hypothetical protein